MSRLDWEAWQVVLGQAQLLVEEHSPYAQKENWPQTKVQNGYYAERLIIAMQALPVRSRVLDVGPGYGVMTAAAMVLGHRVTAVELFHDPLPYGDAEWVTGSVLDPELMAFWDAQFDLCLMTEVLEHFTCDPSGAFTNIAKTMKVGGLFYGTTPHPGGWPGDEPTSGELPKWEPGHVAENRHVRLYSMDETEAYLKNAGFGEISFELLAHNYRYLWRAKKEQPK